MVIFRSNFSFFLSFNTQLTHLNASNLLNFDPSNRFLPIASQSWCSGVSKMATYQGAGKRPRQCCHPKGGNGAEGPKGPRTKGTVTRGPEGPESGQNMRVRGPEGPEDEQS